VAHSAIARNALFASTLLASACGGTKSPPESPKQVVVTAPPGSAAPDEPTPALPPRAEPTPARGPSRLTCNRTTDSNDVAKARKLFEIAVKAYVDGDYRPAADAFKTAYQTSCKAAVLYNLGVCYEKIGEPAAAADVFEQYLEERPDAPEADGLHDKIRELRAQGRGH
jgi:TolA-binding protein